MGLDMYLHAARMLTEEEVPLVGQALALPDRSEGQRAADEDGSIYISGWDHVPDPAFALLQPLCPPVDQGSPHLDVIWPTSIRSCIGYWRKENAIHRFFVDEAQGGRDECQESPVSRELLTELLSRCLRVINHSEIVPGIVRDTVTIGGGDARVIGPDPASPQESAFVEEVSRAFGVDPGDISGGYAPGKVLADPTLAEELLPTQGGFFFGGTGYDEQYVVGLADTALICARALDLPAEWSFTYRASW